MTSQEEKVPVMNKVGAVLISSVAVLCGCWGLYNLAASSGPEGGGIGLLIGLITFPGSLACAWGAWRVWQGDMARMTLPEALGFSLVVFFLVVGMPGLIFFSLLIWFMSQF